MPLCMYLHDHRIIHETSCAHTAHQNGVSKRKHKHLFEITRCLLLNMLIPKYFWPEALLTFCFLINRTPSSVVKNKMPYVVLHPNNIEYLVKPKVFECTCFVHLLHD